MKKCGIYKITNLINKKMYIGQSIDIESRWTVERSGHGINTHLKRSMIKYGKENFKFEILEEIEDLENREKYWILYYKSYDPNIGYNKSFGGESPIWTEDNKKNLKKFVKRGKEHYKSKAILNLETGEVFNTLQEVVNKYGGNICDINRCCRKFNKNNFFNGYHWSYYEEGKKLEDYEYRKKKEILSKKSFLCIETGEIYKSLKQICKQLGSKAYRNIHIACKDSNRTIGGFYWKYCED